MTPIKQTVYLPVKVEDSATFLITQEIKNYLYCNCSIYFYKDGKCIYTPSFITKTTKESKELEHLIIERLDNQEGYFFTPEELNAYTQSVIKQALETAAENANSFIDGDESVYIQGNVWSEVDEQSITNTFEETYKKFEV